MAECFEGAKGGEEMKINREDVVQAALMIERWCDEKQDEYGNCDCPFAIDFGHHIRMCKISNGAPSDWSLAHHLRNRGMEHDD